MNSLDLTSTLSVVGQRTRTTYFYVVGCFKLSNIPLSYSVVHNMNIAYEF